MFIRVYRPNEQKEVLINTHHIWKIEVTYGVGSPNQPGILLGTSLQEGIENPEAIKHYKVFAGSDTINLVQDPNCPVVKVIEDIYKNSVKGNG
jgi:hypothetical protein